MLTRVTERPCIAATCLMWPAKQRLRKEVVARPVQKKKKRKKKKKKKIKEKKKKKKKKSPVSWSPITQLNMLIEKRYWKFLAAKR